MGREVLTKAATDVAIGRALVFPVTRAKEIMGFQISPVGVVEQMRVTHGLKFGGGATARRKEGTKEPEANIETGGRLVNADMDWKRVPEYRFTGDMTAIITRILRLRASLGHGSQFCFRKMAVKIAFRQVGIAGSGSGLCVSAERANIRTPLVRVQTSREPRVVGSSIERKTGN